MNEKKKKMSTGKKILIGIGIYAVVGVVVVGIFCTLEDKKKAASFAEEAARAKAEEATKPAAERFQKAVGLAQKNNKLNTGVDKILALRCAEDACEVDVKINAYWNEDRVIADGSKFGLAVAKEIFTRCPEYKVVRLQFFVDMQDQFGNVKETDVFNYNIWAETFAKVNFENFSDMVIVDYNSMWPLAENVYISPGILKNLKKYHR